MLSPYRLKRRRDSKEEKRHAGAKLRLEAAPTEGLLFCLVFIIRRFFKSGINLLAINAIIKTIHFYFNINNKNVGVF